MSSIYFMWKYVLSSARAMRLNITRALQNLVRQVITDSFSQNKDLA